MTMDNDRDDRDLLRLMKKKEQLGKKWVAKRLVMGFLAVLDLIACLH